MILIDFNLTLQPHATLLNISNRPSREISLCQLNYELATLGRG